MGLMHSVWTKSVLYLEEKKIFKERTKEDEGTVLGQSTSGLALGKKASNNAKTACLDDQPVHCIGSRSIPRKEPVGRKHRAWDTQQV